MNLLKNLFQYFSVFVRLFSMKLDCSIGLEDLWVIRASRREPQLFNSRTTLIDFTN